MPSGVKDWLYAFYTKMNDRIFSEIRDLEIPYLGTEYPPKNPKVKRIISEVLKEEGITSQVLEAERVGIKLFSDGVRKAIALPQDLKMERVGRGTVKLSFILPPGSYATVLLRKLFLCERD